MILVSFESWRRDLSKLMIRFWWTMPNFQILSKIKFRSSPKNLPISSNLKFEIFLFRQNLTKNQNSATVVYCLNLPTLSKFQNQNFPKLVPIWAHNRDNIFPKFWSRYQNPKITKIGSTHQNLNLQNKILKTRALWGARPSPRFLVWNPWARCNPIFRFRWPWPNLMFEPKTRKICDKIFFLDKIWWFCENLDFGDFVKFGILNPSENQNFGSLTLDHKIWILMTKITFFDEFSNFE